MARQELERVLDFIMNRADETEFDVIRQACERRVHDRGAFEALGSTSATAMAKGMAEGVESMMGASLQSIRGMMRNFVEDLILKEEPGISQSDLEALVEHYLPKASDPHAGTDADSAASLPQRLGLPAEMLLGMARDFVSFSEGSMSPSRQKQLWDEMPRWQEEYWKAFPAEVKALVKGYLEGRLDAGTFTTGLLSLLGL